MSDGNDRDAVTVSTGSTGDAKGSHGPAVAVVDQLAPKLSNWGRWGEGDELGTLNLITQSKRHEAAACVRTGELLSLATPLQSRWPQVPGSGRLNCQHWMHWSGTDSVVAGGPVGYADDAITMSVHAHTHWDALSHSFHNGAMWGGRSAADVSANGAAHNDIRPLAESLVSRAVLLDLTQPEGEPLSDTQEILVADLENALERQRVQLRSGDVLLLRTGHLGRARRAARWNEFVEVDGVLPREPGIGCECLPWLHDHDVAAVACDNWGVEVMRGAETTSTPVHELALVYMGMPLGELFELDALAERCRADGHWDFLFSGVPLPIEGAVGGPVNPVALR